MRPLLNWFLLSTLSLGVLWLFYHLVLRRERCFGYNRALLVLAPPLAALLPLLSLPTRWLPAVPTAARVPLHLLLPTVEVSASAPTAGTLSPISWLLIIYGAGVALLLARLGRQLWQLWRFTRTLPAEPHQDYTLRHTGGRRPTGSFGRTVFWDETAPLTSAEAAQIFAHELVHVRQRHTLDRLWLAGWQALLWPNLFVHLLPRALDLTHEYLADSLVAPAAPTDYVRLLARQATGWLGQAPALTHSFFSSSTLTRIAMLNRPFVTRPWKQWLALPVLGALLFVVGCEKNTPADEAVAPQIQVSKQAATMPAPPPPPPYMANEENAKITEGGSKVYFYVEQMPEPAGGMSGLMRYIGEHVHYPEAAKQSKLEGRVFVNFIVAADGTIQAVKIMKGSGQVQVSAPGEVLKLRNIAVDPAAARAMDEEALRVVSGLPRWTPGKQGGKAVAVSFTIPIMFALK